MTPADAEQQRLLECLREAGDEAVAFVELHVPGGVAFPAAVVSELELRGYAIERVYDHRRLVGVRGLGSSRLQAERTILAKRACALARAGRAARSARVRSHFALDLDRRWASPAAESAGAIARKFRLAQCA